MFTMMLRVVMALPVAVIMGALLRCVGLRFSAWKGKTTKEGKPTTHITRIETLFRQTLNFMLAWFIWNGFSALWSGLPSSHCFDSIPAVVGEKWGWLVAMVITLALLGYAISAALGGPKCKPQACGKCEAPAIAWDILLATISIQLGWAIKATFDNATKLTSFREEYPVLFDVALMLVLMLLMVIGLRGS